MDRGSGPQAYVARFDSTTGSMIDKHELNHDDVFSMSFDSKTENLGFACYSINVNEKAPLISSIVAHLYLLPMPGGSPKKVRTVAGPDWAFFSSREALCVVTDQTSFVRVEECTGRKTVATFHPSAFTLDVLYAFGPDHQTMAVTGPNMSRAVKPRTGHHVVSLWKAGKRVPTFVFADLAYVTALSYSVDGQYVAAADEHGIVRVWNTDSGLQVMSLDESNFDDAKKPFRPKAKFVGNADILMIAGRDDIRLWSIRDNVEVERIREPEAIAGSYFIEAASDGKMILMGWQELGTDGKSQTIVRLWTVGLPEKG